MKALVLGGKGQLARELHRASWPADWAVEYAGRTAIDLARPDEAAAGVLSRSPDIVINAGAYTAVDNAEREPDLANLINAESPRTIALACKQLNIPFVTVSTDYVFDGSGMGAHREDDAVAPLGAYGRSKELGERYVRDATEWHLIFRTSWLFSAFGANFVRTMLRLGAERPLVSIVADQRGKPTAVGDLAACVIAASKRLRADRDVAGTYHVANADAVTWYDFAEAIFAYAKAAGARVPETVRPITTAEYPTPAKRPANSELACEKFERAFGMKLRSWREALPGVLDELLAPSAITN